MSVPDSNQASFEVQGDALSRVVGALNLSTVGDLLSVGGSAITRGDATLVDLAGVGHSDSSGLALLIEWLSVAHAAGKTLRYENMPNQLQQLARLSEVEGLLLPALNIPL